MARKRASMREGPLAELFRATEAAQRGQTDADPTPEAPAPEPTSVEPQPASPAQPVEREEQQLPLETPQPDAPEQSRDPDATVEHVYDFEVGRRERRGQSEPIEAPPAADAPTTIERAPTPAPVESVPPKEPAAAPRAEEIPGATRALHAPGEQVRQPDAREPAAPPRCRRRRLVPRRDPCRRRRRRRHQRRESDDGCRYRAGRFRRGQHRRSAARPLGCPGEAPHRRVDHPGTRVGLRPGDGTSRRRGGLRPDPYRAPRQRHGLRHRRRGRWHRHRRRTGRGEDRPRARRADRRDRHHTVQVRGHAPPDGGSTAASRRSARRATP